MKAHDFGAIVRQLLDCSNLMKNSVIKLKTVSMFKKADEAEKVMQAASNLNIVQTDFSLKMYNYVLNLNIKINELEDELNRVKKEGLSNG